MSKYPEKIDSSVELPVVRNNITEATSEIINKIRSAVINIERAVGIYPQGEKNSLSDRVSVSIDASGNIKRSALTNLNILTGKISDSEVSNNAGISESKLDLKYSTSYLQNQITILKNIISDTSESISDINSSLKIHLDKSSLNQHNAIQISIDSAPIEFSSSASKNVSNTNVFSEIKRIYSGHVNFSGTGVTETNNSHTADQIHYESSLIVNPDSKSVSDAIDYLLGLNSFDFSGLFSDFSTNSIFLEGSTENSFDGGGEVLYNDGIFFSENTKNIFAITLDNGAAELPSVSAGDSLEVISSESGESYFCTILAIKFINESLGTVKEVMVSGSVNEPYSSGMTGKIRKTERSDYNKNSFNMAVRPASSSSSDNLLVCSNPEGATIISSGFKVPSSSSNVVLEISATSSHTIQVFDSSITNSIESVLYKLNYYFSSNHLPVIATKIETGECQEICISSILSNSTQFAFRPYLRIRTSTSSDLGFSHVYDKKIYGSNGNSSIANGTVINDPFSAENITDRVSFSSGNNFLSILSGSPESSKIKEKDFIYIEQGGDILACLTVDSVFEETVSFSGGYTFSSSKEDSTKIFLISNTIFIDFSISYSGNTGINRAFLYDIYYMPNGRISATSLMESFGSAISTDNDGFITQCRIIDLSDGVGQYSSCYLNLSSTKFLNIQIGNNLVGQRVFAPITGTYKVPFPDGKGFALVHVITSKASVTSQPFSVEFETINNSISEGIRLCSVLASDYLGYYYGQSHGDINISYIQDKRDFGYVGPKQISSKFYRESIDLPRSETMDNFVSSGFGIISQSNSHIEIEKGVAYINGRRVIFDGGRVDIDNSQSGHMLVILGTDGCIHLEILNSQLPKIIQKQRMVLYYSNRTIRLSQGNGFNSDNAFPSGNFKQHFKRFGEIQKKFSEITVGSRGNFLKIKDAVEFARSHDYLMQNSLEPFVIKLLPESHVVSEPIILGNFNIRLEGSEGSSIKISEDMLDSGNEDISSNFGFNPATTMFITTSDLTSGRVSIHFKNIEFNYISIESGFFCVNIVYANGNNAPDISTNFENCKFLGSEDLSLSLGDDNSGSDYFNLIPVTMKCSEGTSQSRGRSSLTMSNNLFYRVGSGSGTLVFVSHDITATTSLLNFEKILVENCTIENSSQNPDDFEYITIGANLGSQSRFNIQRNVIVSNCVVYNK